MHVWLTIIASLGVAAICVPATSAQTPAATRRDQLNAALRDEWEYQLRTHPELATYAGDRRYNDRLSDYSPRAFADDLQHVQQTLVRLDAIDTSDLPEADKLNKALIVRSLREQVESAQFKEWE